MNPALLGELLAAWMCDYMYRASKALAQEELVEPSIAAIERHYRQTMMPAWYKMMEDYGLPLEAPPDFGAAVDDSVEHLAGFLREHVQQVAAQRAREDDTVDPSFN